MWIVLDLKCLMGFVFRPGQVKDALNLVYSPLFLDILPHYNPSTLFLDLLRILAASLELKLNPAKKLCKTLQELEQAPQP